MSLYFAANRWGSGDGIYDYKAQADRILSNMRHVVHLSRGETRTLAMESLFLSCGE